MHGFPKLFPKVSDVSEIICRSFLGELKIM